MDEKTPEYQTGRAPVGGPLDALADHGAPPQRPPVDRMTYTSPGPPPWAAPAPPPLNIGRKRSTGFAIIAAVVGSVLVLLACLGAVALSQEAGPVPSQSTPATVAVKTSGTCEKKVIGAYGLVATVKATNGSRKAQEGILWVRWPVTGEAAQEFTKEATLAPGESVELMVNENVAAERWFRVGECSHGWTPTG